MSFKTVIYDCRFLWLVLFNISVMGGCSGEKSFSELQAKSSGFELPQGVWVSHVNSPVYESRSTMEEALDQVEGIGANAIYPVVWNKQSFFFSSSSLDKTFGSEFTVRTQDGEDILATMSSLARKRGLKVFGSFESGLKLAMRQEDKETLTDLGQMVIEREHWLLRDSNGKLIEDCQFDVCFGYLNILNAEVESFLWNMAKDILKNYDVDGLIFDDHFALPAWPGSCDPLVKEFPQYQEQKNSVFKILPFQDQTKHCEGFSATLRREAIISFLKKVRDYASELDKKVMLSPAGLPSWSKREWHQDWQRLVLEKGVDGVIMQAFRGLTYKPLVYSHELTKLRSQAPDVPLGVVILLGLKEAHKYAHGERIFRQVRTALAAGRTPSFFYHETIHMPAEGYTQKSRTHWISKTKKLLLNSEYGG